MEPKLSNIKISTKGLNNISFDESENDFEFIIGSDDYHVPHFLAEFISPIIARLRKQDKSISSFCIPIEDENQRFRFIVDLMYGNDINISNLDAQILRYFAEKLGNYELFDELDIFKPDHLSEDNVFNIIMGKYRIGLNFNDEIQFIAMNFNKIDKSKIGQLPVPLIEAILSSKDLQVNTEDDLFNFICELIQRGGDEYRILMEYILFEFLNEESMDKFLNMTSIEDVNSSLWNALSKRLLKPVSLTNKEIEESQMNRFLKGSIPFKGNPFNGIVNYIKQKTGENPHLNGQIKISYLSGNPYCEKLFDYDWKCYWSSTNSPGQWINFEFTNNLIYLTDYSLKTPNSRKGWNHLKSWVIEGSLDGISWTEIDEQNDSKDLNGNNHIATFHCRHPTKAKFIRLRQIGKNHHNSDDIQLTNIEFFGRILDSTN